MLYFKFLILLLTPIFTFSQIDSNREGNISHNHIPNKLGKLKYYQKQKSERGKSGQIANFDPVLAENLQYALDSTMSVHGLIGSSASIILANGETWNGVYGMSNPVTNDSVNSDMHFLIASNTKAFIGTLILMLRDEGLLTLDDQISKWLPPMNHVDSTITIRQLLNHTNGLYDFVADDWNNYETDIFTNPGQYWSPEYSISRIGPKNFPVGTDFQYNQTGYVLLGMIIKSVTNQATIAQILRQKIFTPFGLDSMYFGYEEQPIGNLAHGWYDYTGSSQLDDLTLISSNSMISSLWTAGAIYSKAEDFARWLKMLFSGDILPDSSLQDMKDFVSIPDWGAKFPRYGLGVYMYVTFGDTLWGNDGNFFGYSSAGYYSEKHGVSIVVLLNQDSIYSPLWWSEVLTDALYEVVINHQPSTIQQISKNPEVYDLKQNYPNPFNPTTTIEFSIPNSQYVSLKIYNLLGQKVSTLVSKRLKAGNYQYNWDASGFASGVYYCKMVAGEFAEVRKLIFLR